ncbi:hypothetical protein F5888DRAFT_1805571 [Russula emetica]|nr:hypothetical protein F5888DRAFT_1805571 [Russula emetica]
MKCTSFVSDFAHHAVRNRPSVPSEGRFEGIEIEKVFTAVGLGGAAQPRPARRGMLSRDLFESPSGARSRGSSAENGRGNGLEGITHEKSMAEDDKNAPLKNLPYSFPGFGPRDSGEQQQIPFPPSLPPYWKEVQEAMMTIRKMYVELLFIEFFARKDLPSSSTHLLSPISLIPYPLLPPTSGPNSTNVESS